MPEAPTPARPTGRRRHIPAFWRHYLEMLAAMAIGMFAGTTAFAASSGVTWDDALADYPVQSLLVMAFSMTVPMVAWMRHRHHDWKHTTAMATAMVVPVVPFICLVVFGVIDGALCGLYCALTVVGMLALMLYQRSHYTI